MFFEIFCSTITIIELRIKMISLRENKKRTSSTHKNGIIVVKILDHYMFKLCYLFFNKIFQMIDKII